MTNNYGKLQGQLGEELDKAWEKSYTKNHEHHWELVIEEYEERCQLYTEYYIVCKCGEKKEVKEKDD